MPPSNPIPTAHELLAGRRRILVTDGAGVVRRLLEESYALLFNLDKMGCASDLSSIEALPQAAESHVDRSIKGPAAYGSTISPHWEALPAERADGFRFHHISTDEVFGSLCATGRFSETNA